MDPQERETQRRSEVSEAIFPTSRRDEDTVSAVGADILAAQLDGLGMLTDPCVCAAYVEYPDGPAEECPRHGRPYEYWVDGCTVMSQRLSRIRDLHQPVEVIKQDADYPEGRKITVCAVCSSKEYPCDTVKILEDH